MIYERKIAAPQGITSVNSYCKSIFNRFPDNSTCLFGLARFLLAEGCDDAAVECLQDSIAQDSKNFEVNYLLMQLIRDRRGYDLSDEQANKTI